MRQLPPRMQDQLYHEMILPGETLEIRKKAREFAVKEIVSSLIRTCKYRRVEGKLSA